MPRQKTIMVAVREPDKGAVSFVRKATALAQQHDATLRLVHVIALPQAPVQRARPNVRQAADDEYNARAEKLEKLGEIASRSGVVVRTSVEWDYPVAHALARFVQKHKPSTLLIQPHRRGDAGRRWLGNLDWEVIRSCPCPVWISKTDKARAQVRVLAAVDPFHANDKPKPLDDVILRAALDTAGDGTRVFVCHAVPEVQPGELDAGLEAEWVKSQDPERITQRNRAPEQIQRLCKKYGIPTRNIIIQAGEPKSVILRAAEECKATLAVMGAVSRSALKRIFIGATAEELLDDLSCDVLVVKPRGFQTDVAPHPQPLRSFPRGY